MTTFAAVVLGGGPAGAVAALELARSGLPVGLLVRPEHDHRPLGETLPPAANPVLRRLGLWDDFRNDGHAACPGTVSCWEHEEPSENDCQFDPYGHGWHLDRARFDRMLVHAAEKAGVMLVRSARVRTVDQEGERGWSLCCDGDGGREQTLTAMYLIEATGRSAWLARRRGAHRLGFDRLVGVVGFAEGSSGLAADEFRTLVEPTAMGWWYAAQLPGGRAVAALMTDADLLPRGTDRVSEFWRENLRDSPLIASFWSGVEHASGLRVASAATERLDRAGGPRWVAAGDAAMAFDPLSSQGILFAIESGRRAAAVAAAAIRHDGSDGSPALDHYERWLAAEFASYQQRYFWHYGRITRWPDSPFWRRRRSAGESSTAGDAAAFHADRRKC